MNLIIDNHPGATTYRNSVITNLIGWIFGIAVFAAGVINIFWGNDPLFGVFILALSFVYFPPAIVFVQKVIGLSIHWTLKILLAASVIVATLGVGELFEKIDLMMKDLG